MIDHEVLPPFSGIGSALRKPLDFYIVRVAYRAARRLAHAFFTAYHQAFFEDGRPIWHFYVLFAAVVYFAVRIVA